MTECTCNMDGSVDNVCDVTTGECNCKPNIIGELCDEVEDGWWNFPTPEGNFFLKSFKITICAFQNSKSCFKIFLANICIFQKI